jgi:hypothetical protein
MSVAAAQEALRGLIWDDLIAYLKEKCPNTALLEPS